MFPSTEKYIMARIEEGSIFERIVDEMKDLSSKNTRKTKYELIQRSTFLLDLLRNPFSLSIPGERAFAYNKHRTMIDLPENLPTKELLESIAVDENHLVVKKLSRMFPGLMSRLTMEKYCEKFRNLLLVEDAFALLTLRQYDKDNVIFRKEDGYLVLDVAGLADGRPSLLPGDIAVCYPPGLTLNCGATLFEGVIHMTSQEAIYLKFHNEFMRTYNYEKYNIYYKVNRTIVRRLYGALDSIRSDVNKERILFPKTIDFKEPMMNFSKPLKWFNDKLNPRQRQAIESILEGKCRPSPYIVLGPPGTGKTVTIVEAILQIFFLNPNSRILACSGSNFSADSIAAKLVSSGKLKVKDLVRIIAFSRWEHEATPKNILPYSQLCLEGNQANWLNHRIVVSTCTNSTKFGVFSKGTRDFDYVFIDEASTVTEPESLLVILLASLKKESLVVLVGDPEQLGPVVISPFPGQLSTPLIERLCSFGPYLRTNERNKKYGFYDPRCITKLVQCYRCCTELIKVNSDLFYDSEIKSNIERNTKLLTNFKNFPILFVGVVGKDDQMYDSPSWFNLKEAISVTKYVADLFKAKVKANQIAIITPYRKQVEVINALLNKTFEDPKKIPFVTTVESFQGLERRVIILSLVRSNNSVKINHDNNFNLGFINSPKRFNVATSRAKQLLIIIGNPDLLIRDPKWRSIMNYCHQNESFLAENFKFPQENQISTIFD